MKKQIDHFLLGLLWLLAITLGASFWFNIRFGFNIFYLGHWEYLGQLQAARQTVSVSFYMSIIVVVFVMIFGLYIIVRPRFRKIPVFKPTVQATHTPPAPPVAVIEKTEPVAQAIQAVRPPRIVVPSNGHAVRPAVTTEPAPMVAPMSPMRMMEPVITPIPTMPPVTTSDFEDIENIFKSAGYTVKKPPRIGNLRPALFAVGPDENLWIGAVGIEPARLADAVDKLRTIFTDTLEDIQIHIHPFIIAPTAPGTDMETFDTVANLRDYISTNPARKLSDDDTEDFDAYSEYVDTVADYFNKV